MSDPKPDLKLVPTVDRLPEMLSDARNGADVAELVNKYGLKRKEAKALAQNPINLGRGRRTKRVDKPAEQPEPTKTATNITENIPETPKNGNFSHFERRFWCSLLYGSGGVLALVVLWVNMDFIGGFGASWESKWAFRALGAACDLATAGLLPLAAMMFRQARVGSAVVGILVLFIWLAPAWQTLQATMGFVSQHMADHNATRESVTVRRGELQSKIDIASTKLGTETRTVGEIQRAILEARSQVPDRVLWKTGDCQTPTLSREACKPMTDEMTALEHAKARDEVQAKIDGWTKERDSLAIVAARNPGAENMSFAVGGWITVAGQERWYAILLACLLNFGGVLMMIARLCW